MKYEKWSLGYWILKQYVRFFDWIIHKNVDVRGKENIPKDKPILFAPNHQNALSDPMAILLHTAYQPVWLARADIFKNPIAAAILRFLKIMPVYRLRDGKDQLSKNDKTFADSIKVLRNNKPLALFPEAAHSGKRQMLAHKKAVPRIVFMAEKIAKSNLDIHIIPTGIYYSSYWKFNREVIVNFGQPIRVNEFLDEYQSNPKSATMALRESIYQGIEPLTINIKSKEHYVSFEMIREIYGNHFFQLHKEKGNHLNRFQSDQILVNRMDQLEKENPEATKKISNLVQKYNQQVRSRGMRNWLIEKPEYNFGMIVLNKLVLLLGLPVFLFGSVLNAIPFFTIDTITRKKIKDIAFWSTFYLVLSLILFPLVYLIELWILAPLLPGTGLKLLFLAALPFAGKLAFRWYILLKKTYGRSRLLLLVLFNKKEWLKMKEQQVDLFSILDRKL